MRNIVIGTAGHIDHGKTTLIKKLTGIETDTTKEEKKRGLSINLGFAYLDLPGGERVGIVDVPGHEKFIKNMVAGLPGLSLILLVVDAGEGIMPQTKEHIDILTLLGMENFIIVLTKVETVDDEIKALVIEDIRDQLEGTVLENAPLVETDALTGRGMTELLSAIESSCKEVKEVTDSPTPRLNVDRVFSVKGFGTVVTGTLIEGQLALGDELISLPSGKKTKIRNIQVHDRDVETVEAGQRTALNLMNMKQADISRGDVLTVEGAIEPTWMIDAKVSYLSKNKDSLGLWERVRVLVGTTEVMARTVPIGNERLVPGTEGFVQLRLEEVIAVKAGDRFVIRSYSPMETIGGGVVLEANPKKHRRFSQEVIESLEVKEKGSLEELLLDFLRNNQEVVTSPEEIVDYLEESTDVVEKLLAELEGKRLVKQLAGTYLHQEAYQQFSIIILTTLADYHKAHRLRQGMPLEAFRSKVNLPIKSKELDLLLTEMVNEKLISHQKNQLALADFEVTFNKYQLIEKERLEDRLLASGFVPQKVEELVSDNDNAGEVLEALTDETVIFVTHDYVIHREYFEQIKKIIKGLMTEEGEISLANFRDRTASNRKASLMVLEYLDKIGLTKRVGDNRVLK